jgi:hypothetical protein
MLGGSREAHDPSDQRVVAAVGPFVGGKQLIQPMGRTLTAAYRNIE